MVNGIQIEIMCGSLNDVITATEANVDRIELNQAMELLGLTPTINTLKSAKKITNLPIVTMVRPRGAGFNYYENELRIMLEDAKLLLDNGSDGIVFGFLKENGELNTEYIKRMVDIIGDKEKVFHKAFDYTRDLEEAICQLIDLGVDRVLTEGGNHKGDILKGSEMIAYLQRKYGDQINIVPAGGVNAQNVREVLNITKCKQIHFSAKEYKKDSSTGQNYLRVSKTILNDILLGINN